MSGREEDRPGLISNFGLGPIKVSGGG